MRRCPKCGEDKDPGSFWKNQYKCKECSRTFNKEWSKLNRGPGTNRWRHLKSKYGISEQAWNALFSAQTMLCAICNGDDPKSSKGWATDHEHETGRVRGILCHPCNTIVHKHATPDILIKAAEYLQHENI